ncbi:MAG: aconitase X, partial [Sphingomonas sp.]
MIALEPVDRALLDGEHGAAAARAMAILMRYGEASGARRFVSVQSAHIDGCLYHGPSSIDFARRFVDLGGRVRVPTTLNVAAVDVTHPDWH